MKCQLTAIVVLISLTLVNVATDNAYPKFQAEIQHKIQQVFAQLGR
jgi:hypothetical protein